MKGTSTVNASQKSVSIVRNKPEEPLKKMHNSHPFQSWQRLTFEVQSPSTFRRDRTGTSGNGCLSHRLPSLKRTVSRVGNVNSALGAGWNELNSDGLRLRAGFIPDDVPVVMPTLINERHALAIHMGRAVGVVTFVVRHRSLRNDDQAVTRMGVPAGGSTGLPGVLLHVQIGRGSRLLRRRPGLARLGNELVKHIDVAEPAAVQRGAAVPRT